MDEERIDIGALAALARIAISEEEKAALAKEVTSILAFVKTIQEVGGGSFEVQVGVHRNVMRDDEHPHAPGVYEGLVAAATMHTDTHVKVKQVITGGKHAQQ